MTPAIAIRDLHKTYREGIFRRRGSGALRGIELTVEQGQMVALLGPNGAGKTTALHCLLGLLLPDQGTVEIFGAAPTLASTRARVGFQSEIFFSYLHASARHCLEFYADLGGLDSATRAQAIDRVLHTVGLEHAADQRVGSFSKGMVQRLGLAQSLLHDPEVLIWDEPTSGLDPEGRRLVVDLLLDLKKRGKTVLLSSHVLPDIEKVCEHVAIMARGKILITGTVQGLCQDHGGISLEDLYLRVVREAAHVA